ncbi:DUF3397 domain-containing protein [Priestia koreensis]|uniref:DUF3397 domain-containing protein n=1 Tax=Priestia koreensis TaxID=284581 RepID=UPI00203BBF07|nr:DUF3397 domain-containing protein [Priestia koreensis]MCM3003875.1 DUF3397 domain-containing protein [Priestia koreensis]
MIQLGSFFAGVIATFVTVPFLAFLLSYIVFRKVTKNNLKSFRISVDVTTIFLIGSVYHATYVIWGKSYLWAICLVLLLTAIMLFLLHWKYKQDIQLRRIWKGFWRMNFLLFTVGYAAFAIYGVVARI